jgi:hypothetical protein
MTQGQGEGRIRPENPTQMGKQGMPDAPWPGIAESIYSRLRDESLKIAVRVGSGQGKTPRNGEEQAGLDRSL